MPGYGRPQELINREVEACDLFIGILWRRWGQSTKEYSSGFEEEFELARKRRQETKSPEIWLFFKKVDDDQLKDPGEQLKCVLEFQQAQVAAKELLFKEFGDVDDWEGKFQKCLLQYLLELAMPRGMSAERDSDVSSPVLQEGEAAIPSSLSEGPDESPAILQYKNLMNSITRAMASTEFNFPLEEERAKDEFYAARLHLLAMAWLSSRYTNELLSVHEINVLYRHRGQLRMIGVEATLISETLISNSFDTAPGWHWFAEMTEDGMERLLFYLAVNGRDVLVRQRSVQLIKAVHPLKPIEFPRRREELGYILEDQSQDVRKAALNYVSAVGGFQELALIEPLLVDQDTTIRNQAELTRLLILARNDPQEGLAMLVKATRFAFQQAELDEVIAELGKNSSRIESELLLDLVGNQDAGVPLRIFALTELSERGLLSPETLLPLLDSPSVHLRAAYFQELIKLGVEVDPKTIRQSIPRPEPSRSFWTPTSQAPDADDLVLRFFESLPLENITPQIDWYSNDGRVAYTAMAVVYGGEVLSVLRSDLRDKFKDVREASLDKIRQTVGDFTEQFAKSFEEVDDFVKYQFARSALTGLAVHGGPEDAAIARSYLKGQYYSDLKIQAVRILGRFGDSSDIDGLLEMTSREYGELQREAAIAALKLSPGANRVASHFLESNDATLISLTISTLVEREGREIVPTLRSLLDHKTDSVRVEALSYLIDLLPTEAITELLGSYMEQPSYFYNVVCWLDRILYAPSPLREAYQRMLQLKGRSL